MKSKTSVYLTIEQAAELVKLQRVTGVPTARRIREGIDLVLARQRALSPVLESAPLEIFEAPAAAPAPVPVLVLPGLPSPNGASGAAVVRTQVAPGAYYAPRKAT